MNSSLSISGLIKSGKRKISAITGKKDNDKGDGIESSPEDELVYAFKNATKIILHENDLLKANNFVGYKADVEKKVAAFQGLSECLKAYKQRPVSSAEDPSPVLKEAIKEFNETAEVNRGLLSQSIRSQNIVLELIIQSATQDASVGYNAKGGRDFDKSRLAISLRPKV